MSERGYSIKTPSLAEPILTTRGLCWPAQAMGLCTGPTLPYPPLPYPLPYPSTLPAVVLLSA